jgi:hypothetical protein
MQQVGQKDKQQEEAISLTLLTTMTPVPESSYLAQKRRHFSAKRKNEMPLQNCTESGESGWRWGKSGKCYTGRDGKKKAIQQGISIEGPEKFQRMTSGGEVDISENDIPLISYAMHDDGYPLSSIVAVVATIRSSLLMAGKEAGYPPNCNHGYEEKDGKCVLIDDVKAKEEKNKCP